MTGSFSFLQAFWPDLHELASKAERNVHTEPEITAVRLRAFGETMVTCLFRKIGLPEHDYGTQFDRLVHLEEADLLDAHLLAKFHTLRQLGNKAAHGGKVDQSQAEELLEDAWSLACWFCSFMRPDFQWLFPPSHRKHPADALDDAASREGKSAIETIPDQPDDARKSTAQRRTAHILPFPEDRIRRIRDEVAEALAKVDPRVRRLRTRVNLHDAFTEDLTGDQRTCLSALEGFLSDREQRIFLLKGYAGTGKTFLAKGLTEFLSTQGRAFRLAAPTGRAAKIISEKTGRPAQTLHSLIYDFDDLKEYTDEDQPDGSETFKFYAKIATNRDQANTVYIVDEASLVSDVYSESEFFRSGTGYLLKDFMSYVGFDHNDHDKKVIFLGDPAQLPPVGMVNSPAFDGAYLHEHFGQQHAGFELQEIVRQKAGSGVIRNVMPLRESLKSGVFNNLKFDFDQDVARISHEELLPLYLKACNNTVSTSAIVITRSNAETAEFNHAIRGSLFPENTFVTSGDRLIVTSNAVVDGHFLANGEFVQVGDVETAVERRTVTLRQRNNETGAIENTEVALTFRDARLIAPGPDGEDVSLVVKILDDHLHDTLSGITAAQQRALYVDFLKRHPDLKRAKDNRLFSSALRQDPYFNALRVKFGYAVTCHKAQGGEWKQVFVNCQTGQNPRTADYFRWLYTAMTRAGERLYLLNPQEVRITIAGEDWWSNNSHPGRASVDAPSVPTDGGEMSLQQRFRADVLSRARGLLADTGIEIEDVAHHQYQEAFYLRRDAETARMNISYNGRLQITRVNAPQVGTFADELCGIFAPLVGQVVTPAVPATTSPVFQATSDRPFLNEFHNRILPLLDSRQIRVTSVKEQQWSQRYTFARGNEAAVVVDIFYNGRSLFTRCMPVRSGGLPGPLLPEVLEVLTGEITV
ncbi:ATP-dependent DNA helicase [Phyllobacterium endophyticum]|uniref:ATP-dependent DNA helicase n=1 Tax=Phyllobacterium endophyticum TaxID=1149773 RepID=UPI001FED9B42|nr:AAA family ATPase [Phyllobacterium endophyticum]